MQRIVPWLLIAAVALMQPSRAQETRPRHDGHQSRPAQADPHAGHHGGKGGMLMVETDPAAVKPGGPTKLKLMIHDADGTMVASFETFHEKKVHLMIVRDALDRFDHVHPDVDASGNMTIEHTFPAGGVYRLYADYKPVNKEQSVATAEVRVSGAGPEIPKLVPNVPGKVKGEGLDAEIALSGNKAAAPVTISFKVRVPTGQPVKDLEAYLGAMGHLVLISADGKDYVHVHPEEKRKAEDQVDFAAHFPKPGLYKGWGQFQRAGKVHVVPFVVKVD